VETDTRRSPAHDEKELEKKREELDALKKHLARLERIAANLRVEIGTIGRIYSSVLDPRIRERRELERRLSRSQEIRKEAPLTGDHSGEPLLHNPHGLGKEGEIARNDTRVADDSPGESFKELYRRVAKAIHPDLSTNEEEKKWRQRLMAEANSAYAKKDRKSLRAILRQWENGPVSRMGRDLTAELALVRRDISWVLERIRVVEAEIDTLKKSDLYRLLLEVEKANSEGTDLLGEMVRNIDEEIRSIRTRLYERNQAYSADSARMASTDSEMREVRFPTDGSIGRLFLRKPGSESFLDWQDYREAHGPVNIPVGTSLRLDVKGKGHGIIPFLNTLNENDLQALFLYGSNDRELIHIRKLAGLKELYLSGKGITDSGLECLQRLQNLHRLYLYDTSVTNRGTETLGRMHGMRCITFCGSGVTEAALNMLKEKLPGCRVIILNKNARKTLKNAPGKT
jgi:hypothetical protein